MSLFSRSSVIFLLVLLFPVVVTGAEAQPARATWGIDYQHTGQSPYVGPHEDAYVLWYKDWGGLGNITMDSMGYIYTQDTNTLFKFDIDGYYVDSYDIPSHYPAGPMYIVISPHEKYILVKNSLVKTDFSEGLLLDEYNIDASEDIFTTFDSHSNPILFGEPYNDGLFWIMRFNLYGDEDWRNDITTFSETERGKYPTVTINDSIICGDTYQYTSDGVLEWDYDVEGERTVDADGNVYVVYYDRVALDSDGNELWLYEWETLPDWQYFTTISYHQDGFILANGNSLCAIDPDDGSIIWGPKLDDGETDWEEKPVIDAEGYIFAYSDYYIQILDSSGNHLCEIYIDWDIIYPGGAYAPPIIAPNGNLYLAGTNGDPDEWEEYLVCLQKYGTWMDDTNFAARVNDDGSVSLSWTDSPEWPFHSFGVDRVIKEERYAGVHPVTEQPLPADGGPYELLDTDLEPGRTYEYTLRALRGDGITHPYGPIEVTIPDPQGRALFLDHPYPNPASSAVTLEYELPSGLDAVELTIYDLSGRSISTQALEPTSGRHSLMLDVEDYPQGVYIARIAGDNASATRRFVISR